MISTTNFLFFDAVLIIVMLLIMNSLAKRERIKVAYVFLAIEFFLIFLFIINLFTHFIFLGVLFVIYILMILILGRKNYYKLGVKEIEIQGKNIDKDITLVYIADLQFDKRKGSFNEKAFENLIQKLDDENFNVLLMGGDYINYEAHLDIFFKYIEKLSKKYEIYSSLGNHDFLWKDQMITRMEKLGVVDLENDYKRIKVDGEEINIVGIEDLWTGNPKFPEISTEDKELTTIALIHNPDAMKRLVDAEFDLGLSGHYHRGQVNLIPKVYVARIVSKYIYGLFNVHGKDLYVTSGIGGTFFRGYVSGYIRWNAPPEIVKLKILKEK